MITRKPIFALLFVVTFALPGCDYFRPAQPEPFDGENPLPPVRADYSDPERTLETLQLAIQDKSATNGQAAYIGGFADPATDDQGFSATFDPFTVARFDHPDTDWNLGREQFFYSSLSRYAPGFTYLFAWGHEFESAPEDTRDATTATLYRSYRLRANPAGRDTLVNEAFGNAELHFILVGNKWKIVKWIDTENPRANFDAEEKSFGYLRLAGPSQ